VVDATAYGVLPADNTDIITQQWRHMNALTRYYTADALCHYRLSPLTVSQILGL
jgi:hypothetical protein